MRLNWFSPLPPARTEIAHYTGWILPTLRSQAEIIVWTAQAEWDQTLENFAEVRCYQPEQIPWAEVNRADLSIYHLGNNVAFHRPIWQVSRCHRGLIVLHDICLQHFFAGLYREPWKDRDGYLAQMELHYGQVGRQDAEAFWGGALTVEYMAAHYPLTPLAVEKALGVLVHTRGGFDDLKGHIDCPIAYAALPYPASPHSQQYRSEVTRLRAGGPPYRVIVFGYIHLNRRLDALLQALAEHPERDRFRLHVYGELWDDEYVRRGLHALHLERLVVLHGFVPAEELDAALATAHLAINLRYPSMGEASASQLRIWDHALPSVVTRAGWYAGLPEDAVAFVQPEHEIADIQGHLSAFLANPERFAQMGENGRRLLEERHTPEVYAKAIIHLALDAQRFRPQIAAYELVKRVNAEASALMNLTTPRTVSAPSHEGQKWRQQQAAALRTLCKELTERGESLGQQHAAALQAIRKTLSGQAERLRQQRAVIRWRGERLRQRQAAGLQTLLQDLAEHGERLRQRRFAALQAIRQAIAEHGNGWARHGKPDIREEPYSSVSAGPAETPTTRPAPVASEGSMGGQSPQEPYTRDDALRFPLSMSNHDTGFRYLFDFMVVAKSLDLRPRAEVLDFGSGSCFVSELLNRLGYLTVAFDIDPMILAIGRERLTLDPRCDPSRSGFVAGDGCRLPFLNESFDGIICMNALHHMPDFGATLAEMCRVLRPGGRAVFSEPGTEHSKQPESINMMEHYGVLERDIVLSEIYELAKAVGFRRMIVKPYVSPEHLELDYGEFDRFKNAEPVSTPYLSPREIADFIQRFHPLFCLEKAGEKLRTSANSRPELLRARITLKDFPTRIRAGGSVKIEALCENAGQSTWLCEPSPLGGYITLGIKVLAATGRILDDSRGRHRLSKDVPPGGHVGVESEFSLEGLKPGKYRVLFDMVNEHVCWFQDIGSEVVERELEIV